MRLPRSLWGMLLATVAGAALAVLVFFRTEDPMALAFALLVAPVAWAIYAGLVLARRAGMTVRFTRRIAAVVLGSLAVLAAGAVLLFRTGDPMLLVYAVAIVIAAWVVVAVTWIGRELDATRARRDG